MVLILLSLWNSQYLRLLLSLSSSFWRLAAAFRDFSAWTRTLSFCTRTECFWCRRSTFSWATGRPTAACSGRTRSCLWERRARAGTAGTPRSDRCPATRSGRRSRNCKSEKFAGFYFPPPSRSENVYDETVSVSVTEVRQDTRNEKPVGSTSTNDTWTTWNTVLPREILTIIIEKKKKNKEPRVE